MRKIFSGIGAFLKTPTGIILLLTLFWYFIMWIMGVPLIPSVVAFTNAVWEILLQILNQIIGVYLGRNLDIKLAWLVSITPLLTLIAADMILASFVLDKLTYFYAQFILPIQNPEHRKEIYDRVKKFEISDRGPTLFIKNGTIVKHEGEDKKQGAGLIVLDTASAVVLRTDAEIKDTVGPGIKFTKPNEKIANSVDLRLQMQFIGPLPDDQSNLKSPEARTRYDSTVGLTLDGFEVAARMSIRFSIKKPQKNEMRPTESGVISNYGYDENAVKNAITREVIHCDTKGKPIPLEWNKFPVHLLVNLWREYIRKFKISELFGMGGPENGLHIIESMINQRMRNPAVNDLDDAGLRIGKMKKSQEFQQLQERGLEVMEIRIHNVFFDNAIDERIVEQWSSAWQVNAQIEATQLKEIEAMIDLIARANARKKFMMTSTLMYASGLPTPKNSFEALQLMLDPIRNELLNGNYLHSEIEEIVKNLEEVWKWTLGNAKNNMDK